MSDYDSALVDYCLSTELFIAIINLLDGACNQRTAVSFHVAAERDDHYQKKCTKVKIIACILLE